MKDEAKHDAILDSWNEMNRARTITRTDGYYIKARHIMVGDRLDLYGDKYADPNSDPALALEFEFAEVEGVELEEGNRYKGSVDCVVISTGAINFACPADHEIEVSGEGGLPLFYECGICDHIHVPGYSGDCRDNAHRFATGDIEDELGPEGSKWFQTDPTGRQLA